MNLKKNISRSASTSLFVGMSLFGMGCVVESGDDTEWDGEEHLGVAELASGGDPGVGNHLRPMLINDPVAEATIEVLAQGPLANSSGFMPSMPFMPSPTATGTLAGARVEILQTLVGCALSPGTSVKDPGYVTFYFNGMPIYKSYAGEVGIAPDWRTRALNLDEQKWLTACVMQRVNRYGKQVMVLLEGTHPAITRTQADKELYAVNESRVWGNLFSSTNDKVYICHEEPNGYGGTNLTMRNCDADTACGFEYVGNCDDFYWQCAITTLWGGTPSAACAGRWQYIRASVQEQDMWPI